MPLLTESICPQLSPAIISQCKANGVRTVIDFILIDPEELAKKTKIPYKDITCIRHILLANYAGFPQRADSLYNMLLESMSILNTGSKRVNKLLKGGIYTGEVTEIHGSSGSGKTQFCLTVAASLISETQNTVLYLDTNCSFAAQRVEQILIQKSEDISAITEKLQKIKIVNVYDIYNLLCVLDYVKNELYKKENTFFKYLKLLVIDSITHLLAPCFGGKFLDGPGLMSNISQQFKVLCSEHMISVLVTNNTVQGKGCETKPALGPNWKYVPSVSLCACKTSEAKYHKLSMTKSCRSGLFKEVCFSITEAGISD